MTISKRQKGIIWGAVIIIVLLLGLTSSQKTYDLRTSLGNRRVTMHLTHLFGIEVGSNESGRVGDKEDFIYHAANNKISEIIIVALIGLTAFITSKKK
jgi:hypothetical protein